MFRRENKNLGNLRTGVQTWLGSYAKLNNEIKRGNRNARIDPLTVTGNANLVKSIRKYVALKTFVNQPRPQISNKAAVNVQLNRLSRNLQSVMAMQAQNAQKLAQLTKLQNAMNQFKSVLVKNGANPLNFKNKLNAFNRAMTQARRNVSTTRGASLLKQAEQNAQQVIQEVPPPLPLKPDEYTNKLLSEYPNAILNFMNEQKLVNLRTQFATRPNFNRQNVGNKILAIQAAINKKALLSNENLTRMNVSQLKNYMDRLQARPNKNRQNIQNTIKKVQNMINIEGLQL